MEVTPDRLIQIKEELHAWSHKLIASKREIQQLLGKLQFIAKCVKPGRLFIARMLDTLRGIPCNNDTITLKSDFRADIYWWQKFVDVYNGVSVLGDGQFLNPGQTFQTDACLVSCGGIALANNECFSKKFPAFILNRHLDINSLELLTIIVACKVWGHKWAGLRLIVECDNEVSTKVINNGRSRSQFLNKCAKELLYVAAQYDFDIRACHIPGRTNTLADQLSRQNVQTVLSSHPQLTLVSCDDNLFRFQHDW